MALPRSPLLCAAALLAGLPAPARAQTAAPAGLEIVPPPPAGAVTVLAVQPGAGVTVARAADGAGAVASVEPLPAPGQAQAAPSGRSASAVTSGYGYRIHPTLRSVRFHAGVDLARPAGTRVLAATAGTVSRAGWAAGYGLLVTIDHGGGVETRYAHLSGVAVSPGQRIGRGDLIGLVGSTGRSTGPHLHYEVRRNGRSVSPVPARSGS